MTFTEFVKRCAKGINNYYWQTIRPDYTFKRRLEIWFRDFTTGIDNLLQWFPIIWCDRYWDSHYLFIIMKKKLENMEKGIREANIHDDAQSDANNIALCINALDRLIKDEYHEIAFKHHDEKWGNLHMQLRKKEEGKEYGLVEFKRDNVVTEEQKAQEHLEAMKCYEFSDVLQKNDLDLLFRIMRNESLKWWD